MGLKEGCGTVVLPLLTLLVIQITLGAYTDEQFLDSIGCSSKNKISILAPNKTLVLKLSRWDDYHRGLSFLNFQCKFRVKAPRGYGVMVTIQQLHLRARSVQSTKNLCRDYVKFEQGDGMETGPICGEVEEFDLSENPKTLIGPRFFYDPKGSIDVAFKFDEFVDEVQKPFKLEVAFTAYSECTSTSLLTRQVKQCSQTRGHSCIDQSLFCDGIVNCGFRGSFGNDEMGCPSNSRKGDGEDEGLSGANADSDEDDGSISKEQKSRGGIAVPMHIFAIASAISGAVAVLLVVLVCYFFRRSFGHRTPAQAHMARAASQRTIELSLSHISVPIAEIPRDLPGGSGEGKLPEDLPPAYEAIFPGPVPEKR